METSNLASAKTIVKKNEGGIIKMTLFKSSLFLRENSKNQTQNWSTILVFLI